MVHLTIAANPILAVGGQIAAIVIGLYALIFILIALVFNLAMAIGLGWLREKANLIKRLRPTVESVNKTTGLVAAGQPVPTNTNNIIKVFAQAPEQVRDVDRKVEDGTDKAMKAVIEFRARTVQAQTIVKAFVGPFIPRWHLTEQVVPTPISEVLDIKSPGFTILMNEKSPNARVISSEEIASSAAQKLPTSVDQTSQATPAAM